ncbi:TetR/AcrR family transcriptional regulator [Schumannella soli]|uniref:TetR/AcrR family transcriptional regulator n=1 Tax=Schumannella soli TaxID=2590779 RepID=A0A506Y7E6_9MICO|nr:TetR/AcrR family transcriptional regulator [Schumannella soli]
MVRYAKSQVTYDALLLAAAEEFAECGLAGARVMRVLRRAGLSQGAMYHHFTSKDDLARALATSRAEAWHQSAEVMSAHSRGLIAIDRLCVGFSEQIASDVRDRAAVRVAHELESGSWRDPHEEWRSAIVRALQQSIADGEVSESVDTHRFADGLVARACALALASGTELAGAGHVWTEAISSLRAS